MPRKKQPVIPAAPPAEVASFVAKLFISELTQRNIDVPMTDLMEIVMSIKNRVGEKFPETQQVGEQS